MYKPWRRCRRSGAALKVVGSILMVPVAIVAGAVVLALSIVGAVIGLVVKLIAFIVTLPVKIAKAIKEKSINNAIDAKAVKSKIGSNYFVSLLNYFDKCAVALGTATVTVNMLATLNKLKIARFRMEELMSQAFTDENPEDALSVLNEDLSEVQNNREAVLESNEKFNFIVDPFEAKTLTTGLNRMAPLLKKYQANTNKLKQKLDATKQAVDKAKNNHEAEVGLDNNMAYIDKNSVQYLRFSQTVIKHCSYAVRYTNEWATESGRSVLVSGKASKVANSVNVD